MCFGSESFRESRQPTPKASPDNVSVLRKGNNVVIHNGTVATWDDGSTNNLSIEQLQRQGYRLLN